MARKRNWWYVLVLTEDGPVFVTGFENRSWCKFDKLQAPLEMSQERAKDVAYGLTLNFHTAFAVCSCVERTCQPFMYDRGQFKWEWNKKEGESNAEA